MNISIDDKVKSVINDYNDIVNEYIDDFGTCEKYNIYIKKWLDTLNSGNILDVGCGFGRDCHYINSFKNFKSIGFY